MEDNAISDAERTYQALLQAGLIQASLPVMLGPVAEKERLEAAGAYGQAGPLSDLIIAERDDV
ncbi:MAG: hypothetical protein KC419_25810 [Anaerolineales bacterium]|nr:hypothetical protein [Anaerolineales bacterium]MCA9931937.1 hypothetical protein [Anaerolineales bacterium]